MQINIKLIYRLIFSVVITAFSSTIYAEKYPTKNVYEIRDELDSISFDFHKIKNLKTSDLLLISSLNRTSTDMLDRLMFLTTLSYLYNEMSDKRDQETVNKVIEDYKRMYQSKCDFEKEYKYQFKIEDSRVAVKVEQLYQNLEKSCDIVRNWN